MKGRALTTGPAFALSVVQGSQEAVAVPELSPRAPRQQGQCLPCLIIAPNTPSTVPAPTPLTGSFSGLLPLPPPPPLPPEVQAHLEAH